MTGRAILLGGWLGFFASLACGPSYEQARCMPSNCDGCCDASGVCRDGTTLDACGSLGGSCDACEAAQVCQDGTCRTSTLGGETDGGGNGDGGVNADGGTDGGNGNCSPSNCNGCCRNGMCLQGAANDSCGANGQTCTTCVGSQVCESGACTTGACQGCVDAIGGCQAGNTNTACGASGNACVECFDGQVCENGQCKNTTCSASNCNGCCSNNECLPGDGLAACGAGGVACQACTGSSTCENGACTGGGTGTDGGFFPFPDGGTGACDPISCSDGCCNAAGQCDRSGSKNACGFFGLTCEVCSFACFGGVCI